MKVSRKTKAAGKNHFWGGVIRQAYIVNTMKNTLDIDLLLVFIILLNVVVSKMLRPMAAMKTRKQG